MPEGYGRTASSELVLVLRVSGQGPGVGLVARLDDGFAPSKEKGWRNAPRLALADVVDL